MRKAGNGQDGFTIIELLISMGIFAIITTLVTINLLNAQHIASIDSVTTSLIADLKQQQLKAMIGDTEGRATADQYGIHFEVNKYVLFHGTYNSSDSSNYDVPVEGSLTFTGIAGNGDIIFAMGSGERTGQNPIILTDTLTNNQKTIKTNSYGVITDVN